MVLMNQDTTDCSDCEGQGRVADRNPNDPNHRMVVCETCCGAGTTDPDEIHAAAESRAWACPLAVSECPKCAEGMPRDLADGDLQTTAFRNGNDGSDRLDAPTYREQMRDAGRGHLLRD